MATSNATAVLAGNNTIAIPASCAVDTVKETELPTIESAGMETADNSNQHDDTDNPDQDRYNELCGYLNELSGLLITDNYNNDILTRSNRVKSIVSESWEDENDDNEDGTIGFQPIRNSQGGFDISCPVTFETTVSAMVVLEDGRDHIADTWTTIVESGPNPAETIFRRSLRLIKQGTTRLGPKPGEEDDENEVRQAKYSDPQLADDCLPDCIAAGWELFSEVYRQKTDKGYLLPAGRRGYARRDEYTTSIDLLFWRCLSVATHQTIIQFVRHGGVSSLMDQHTENCAGSVFVWDILDQVKSPINADESQTIPVLGTTDMREYLETLSDWDRAISTLLIAGFNRYEIRSQLGAIDDHRISKLRRKMIRYIETA
jgi:hypothetical protein